jgi:alpha-amylase
VFVHLFEWRWADVAAECESVLGPAGWTAVQVSPPQEHAIVAGLPWYQRYQAVSHSVARSRSGTEAEFRDMVARCRAAGVGIYVDAVVNHMSAGDGTGSNGTVYRKYEYPGLFAIADFHAPCSVSNYQSAENVQDCELFGLADLHTGKPEVRGKIAAYLLSLVRMGVAGFRLDAAKHIQPVELDDILDRVNQGAAAAGLPLPYFFGEVIDHGGEAVKAADYYGLGYGTGGAADLTEFRFRGVAEKFLGASGQKVSDLRTLSESGWGLMPADKAVVFLENHDTQREQGQLGYRHGNVFRLANVFMLAQPYGYPSVMSSFAFDLGRPGGRDMGPPSTPTGETRPAACAARTEAAVVGDWVCEHRDPVIAAMVGFRKAVAGAPLAAWWDNGGNAVAFSRGDRGFVALSREAAPVSLDVATPLQSGTYCDLLTGGKAGSACRGRQVVVASDGHVRLDLASDTGIAIHSGSRL